MASSRNSRSAEVALLIVSAVASVLSRHCPPLLASSRFGGRLVLGLSGGVDSVVLLHVLAGLRSRFQFLQLSALHVHHGLSTDADQWVVFCQDLCRRLAVPLLVERVNVHRDAGLGLECAARHARYAAFQCAEADWIVLAHHQDDQAETVLLNLLRGAGPLGAAAMPESRVLSAGHKRLLRPLLDIPREQILVYARHYALSWVEDASNTDQDLTRNFLRAGVMPLLQTRFPAAARTLARVAGHFAETVSLLDELAVADWGSVRQGDGVEVDGLRRLSPARRKNLLRYWLRSRDIPMPDAAHLEEILRQLLLAAQDAEPCLQLRQGWSLRRYRGAIYLLADAVVEPARFAAVTWQGEPQLPWGGGVLHFQRKFGEGLGAARVQPGRVSIRARAGGESFRLAERRPARSLKKVLQELGVPPWRRSVLPCVWCGEDLVWVAGLGPAAGWECREGEEGWQLFWEV